ncbi:hypothetical protein OU426_00500 [Frigidibacter sp. RF13]|uniref:hypothetical protein n=1 Tax=Frigidibacter sp. RF13 TaxID=2997340 RepID=UPI00226DC579|nr:hypothetical protein [Frigidibacter sp. RF13]MCY1125321.1 hypothetical protein [Frigidibacter sp. RF13]
MNLRWLLRMSQWARNPPSMSRVILGAIVIGLCLLIAGIEWLGLWPEWLTLPAQGKRGF